MALTTLPRQASLSARMYTGCRRLGHHLTNLGLQLFKADSAVGLVLGVQLTAQVPVIATVGLHRQRKECSAACH